MNNARLSPKTERFAAFILMLRRNAPARVSDTCLCDAAAALIRAARTLHRLNGVQCTRNLTTYEQRRQTHAKASVSAALLSAFGNGARWESGGDPRGFSVKLFPGDGSNSFGADCYGVPIE
jgi:hypothetical protein